MLDLKLYLTYVILKPNLNAMYMSCISKTACFSVNCTPLSLQFGQNEELKGSNGSHPSEFGNRTPPTKSDMAPFGAQSLSQSEAFLPLSPQHSDIDNEHDVTLHIKVSASVCSWHFILGLGSEHLLGS